MNWQEHKKKLMADPEFKKEYDKLEFEFKFMFQIVDNRKELIKVLEAKIKE